MRRALDFITSLAFNSLAQTPGLTTPSLSVLASSPASSSLPTTLSAALQTLATHAQLGTPETTPFPPPAPNYLARARPLRPAPHVHGCGRSRTPCQAQLQLTRAFRTALYRGCSSGGRSKLLPRTCSSRPSSSSSSSSGNGKSRNGSTKAPHTGAIHSTASGLHTAAAAAETSAARRPSAISRELRNQHYDVVVVGLGAFGSSVLYHLAKQGLKVLGVERYGPVGHSLGSSHGASRIIRLAYFEGLQYGPLLKRSLGLFKELQEELAAVQGPLREPLFLRVGMLDVGSVFRSSLQSARVHGLQHEVLTGEELTRRFPAYRVPEHWMALYQPDGGVLAPERIVQAHVSLAQRLGAEVLTWHSVTSWGAEGSAADAPVTFQLEPTTAAAAADTATTSGGSSSRGTPGSSSSGGGSSVKRVTAGAAVFTLGPWMGQLVPELRELCVPERQVVGWFEIEAASRRHFAPDRFPVFVVEAPGGVAYYGFPEHGNVPGFKIGLYRHLREEIRDPAALDSIRRTADAADEAALRAGVLSYFPAAASGRMLAVSTCFFTNTPDGHFLVDRHPRHPQVVLCSACSGHGFKMSSGIGQLIARMVLAGPTAATTTAAAAVAGGVAAAAPASQTLNAASAAALDGPYPAPSDSSGDWGELLPFRFSSGERPGHREALERFR